MRKHKLFQIKQLLHRFTNTFIQREILRSSDQSPFFNLFKHSTFSDHTLRSQDVHQNKLLLPAVNKAIRHNCIFFQGIQIYNNLAPDIRSIDSFSLFKTQMMSTVLPLA